MRLIDADALYEKMNFAMMATAVEYGYGSSELGIAQGAVNAITKQPTVDAVPVVRCKHCKYCDYDTAYGVIIPGTEFCTLTQDYCIDENDFCSRGVEAE